LLEGGTAGLRREGEKTMKGVGRPQTPAREEESTGKKEIINLPVLGSRFLKGCKRSKTFGSRSEPKWHTLGVKKGGTTKKGKRGECWGPGGGVTVFKF